VRNLEVRFVTEKEFETLHGKSKYKPMLSRVGSHIRWGAMENVIFWKLVAGCKINTNLANNIIALNMPDWDAAREQLEAHIVEEA